MAKKGRIFLFLTLATGLLVMPASLSGQAKVARPAKPDVGTVPLVNADDELASYITKAKEFIEKEKYDEAIDILTALLGRAEQCFVTTDDPRRFVSLASQALDTLGSMPPDGLALYRRLHDGQADQLLKQARDNVDLSSLREVATRYFHTTNGPSAMNMLAGVLFDRGQFSQAARCWRTVYERGGEKNKTGAVMARVVVSHHFAGEDSMAEKALEILRSKHAEETSVLSGRQQNVLTYAQEAMKLPAPKFASVVAPTEGGWLSLAGAADSAAIMSACYPVLSARWTMPEEKMENNPNLKILGGKTQVYTSDPQYGSRAVPAKFTLKEGQVVMSLPDNNKNPINVNGRQITKPPAVSPLIHPLIVGNQVLYRGADGIIAHDLLTGEKIWDTTTRFPLYRVDKTNQPNMNYYSGWTMLPEDEGMQTLAVSEGRVYAVGNFAPPMAAYYAAMTGTGKTEADTSTLAAFSLVRQGALLWTSNSEGMPDIMRGGKFQCAPTVHAGRLYTIVEFAQSFHLLCLSAETGQLIWKSAIGQSPVVNTSYGYPRTFAHGSPPAVADGKIIVTTNTGVIAGFDQDTGKAIWAYQYESVLNIPNQPYYGGNPGAQLYPPNPIVIVSGRAIVLPSDCPKLLALKLDTGEKDWDNPRDSQSHLNFIDEQRVLVSGPSLRIVNLASGNTVYSAAGITDILGRPAVTNESIMASGKGQLIVLKLDGLKSDTKPATTGLGDGQSILGNLVCYEGKLVAGNAAGVSAYFTYEEARAQLTKRLEGLTGSAAAALLYQRGLNALNAGRPGEGLDDMLEARKQAEADNDVNKLARTGQALYRMYVSLGDHGGNNQTPLDNYTKADAYCYSDRSKGEMLVRLAKHYSGANEPAKAAELAQKLTSDYPKIDLEDVVIGTDANPNVHSDEDTPLAAGYVLGHRLIKQFIDKHGQTCYAAFDATAKADLDKAVAANDPKAMIAVADAYRYSTYGPMGLLRAGESYYRTAMGQPKDKRTEGFSQACQVLGRLQGDYSGSETVYSGKLGMAMIWQQVRPNLVYMQLRKLREESPDLKVAFAEKSGKLGDVLKTFEPLDKVASAQATSLPALTQQPKDKIYDSDKGEIVLRTDDGQPLLHDNCLFVLQNNSLIMLDPSAASFKDGTRWENTLPIDMKRLQNYGYQGPGYTFTAQISKDGAVVVAGRGGFGAVDVKTGKLLWAKKPDDALVGQYASLGFSDELLICLGNTGSITALNMRSGEVAFTHKVPQTQVPFRLPPQIGANVLTVQHGNQEIYLTAFDTKTGKALGSIKTASNPNMNQLARFMVSNQGLLATLDAKDLKLIEPMLNLDQDIWNIKVGDDKDGKKKPADPNFNPGFTPIGNLLECTDNHLFVQTSYSSSRIEKRNQADYGHVDAVMELGSIGGRTSYPLQAIARGDKLFVLATAQPQVIYPGQMVQYMQPSLHVYNLQSGKLLWTADLTPNGGQPYGYMAMPVVGQKHVTVAFKDQQFNRPGQAFVFDSETGKLTTEKLALAAVANPQGNMGWVRMMMMGSPAIAGGRLVVETGKGIEVFGEKPKE